MTNDQISIFNVEKSFPAGEALKSWVGGVTGEMLVKWGLAAGLGMYILFALVIVKQVGIMGETFEDEANGVVKIFAWAHLLMAIVLLVTGILIL